MKILFCPAHFRFTDSSGSEYYSAYNDVSRIASVFPESTVITGKADEQIKENSNFRIIETDDNKDKEWMKDLTVWSTLGSIFFSLKYTYLGAKELLANKYDVIHHVRPFAFGGTFNLLPLLPWARSSAFIIGPFCSPYTTKDLKKERKQTISDILQEILQKILRPILAYLSKITLERADAVLVTDEEAKKLVSLTVDSSKIFVVPHAKDGKEYPYSYVSQPSGNFVILVAGHLIHRKRTDLAIRILHEVRKTNKNVELHIAGDGIERKNLEKLVDELGEGDYVKFLGGVGYKGMPKLYQSSSVFLHVATEEAFGHVYIEALASGVPIVSSNNIGARVILQGQYGIVVDSDDSKDYVHEILSLLNNESERVNFSEKGREYFLKTYDYENAIVPERIRNYKKITE